MVGHRIGSIIHGTLNPADLATEFFHEADGRGGHIEWASAESRNDWWDRLGKLSETLFPNDDGSIVDDDETLCDCVLELSEMLNEIAPPYTYFGAHDGDGADFGFWPEWQSIDELPKYDTFPDTLPGKDFVVVNDHGNASVYGADGRMLWDCV
jgi:hypothetical protein